MKYLFVNKKQKIVWIIYIIFSYIILTSFANEQLRNYSQIYAGPYLAKLVKIISLGIIAFVLSSIFIDTKNGQK